MNERAAQRFSSQLFAMNAGVQPSFHSQGGSVTNVGDINGCDGNLKNEDGSDSEIARIVARLDDAVDLVISLSHCVAKSVRVPAGVPHVCYCFTPMRYAWDLQETYLVESGLKRGFRSVLARILLHYLRIWDMRTANGPERMIANSTYIARRIAKGYRREADGVFPPVDVETMPFSAEKEDFYLAASRMVPYKRMALIVSAFASMPGETSMPTAERAKRRQTG